MSDVVDETTELKAKLNELRKKLKEARAEIDELKSGGSQPDQNPRGPAVSPLAPKDGFPAIPPIDGIRLSSIAAGVKYAGRDDVMLVEVAAGSSIAGVFTRSSTRSAPVLDCQAKLAALDNSATKGFAVLVNSGNANAFTGHAGQQTVNDVASAVAKTLEIPPAHVFTASTGVIGEPLPAEKITAAIETLAGSLDTDNWERAARAIMTTDTFPKGAFVEIELDGKPVKIAGFAKGSGMIAPDMATMLAYVFTDAAVTPDALQTMLSVANKTSFNAVSVDTDTSTSDTVIVAATGMAANRPITSARTQDGRDFADGLHAVLKNLALQIVRDGEGASKLVEVRVTGAKSVLDAEKVARSIADSPLVKTAIAGEDPNWGRVVMAVGKSGAAADRDTLSISFGDVLVADKGWVSPSYREEDGAEYMKNDELVISVDMGLGKGEASVWTCDLTHQYITINADYRS